MAAKPGRNEPCWCGSGTKYKKCHLDADESSARAHARELAEARRDAALAEGAPPGVTVRTSDPVDPSPEEAADARFDLAWASADLDARVALIRARLEGPDAVSPERVFEAVAEIVDDLRGARRTRELDELLTAIATRRPDCVELDAGFYDALSIENALLRGEEVGPLFRARAESVLHDPAALGIAELLAFRGEETVLTEIVPAALPPPSTELDDAGDEHSDDDDSDDDDDSEDSDDEASFEHSQGVLLEDVAFLVGDLIIARAVESDPAVVDHPDALRERVAAMVPVDPAWFERVLRRHAGADAAPFTERDFASDEDGHVEDTTILATHDFFRWLRGRTQWPLSRAVLARMCLADMLLHHLETLRRPSRRGLLVPAQALLRYAGDGEHAASSVALLLAGAWWTLWLVESGWVDAAEAARELRVLRREWPAIVGTAGTEGGDPVLGEALKGFWATFPAALLDGRASVPPRA